MRRSAFINVRPAPVFLHLHRVPTKYVRFFRTVTRFTRKTRRFVVSGLRVVRDHRQYSKINFRVNVVKRSQRGTNVNTRERKCNNKINRPKINNLVVFKYNPIALLNTSHVIFIRRSLRVITLVTKRSTNNGPRCHGNVPFRPFKLICNRRFRVRQDIKRANNFVLRQDRVVRPYSRPVRQKDLLDNGLLHMHVRRVRGHVRERVHRDKVNTILQVVRRANRCNISIGVRHFCTNTGRIAR